MRALYNTSDPFIFLEPSSCISKCASFVVWPLQLTSSGLLFRVCFWDAKIRKTLKSVMENYIKHTHNVFEEEREHVGRKEQARCCSLPKGFGIGARL